VRLVIRRPPDGNGFRRRFVRSWNLANDYTHAATRSRAGMTCRSFDMF
jgi:hypothetical protein